MTEQEKKPQLHYSGLDTLSRCGEQFRRRYIEKDIIPPGVALVVGTATHRSIKKNLSHKLESKVCLPLEQVCDEARDALVSEWDGKGVSLQPEEAIQGVKQVKADAIDKAVRLSRLHATEKAPGLEFTHVERSWVVELKGYPVDLAGQLDIQNGTICVRDTKTAGKSPAASIADESDQLTAYALAVQVLEGKPPAQVALDYLIDNKTPVAKTFTSTRDDSDFRALLHRVENAVVAIEKGVFIPARATDWWCGPKWCGYHGSCKFAKQPKSISMTNFTGGSK